MEAKRVSQSTGGPEVSTALGQFGKIGTSQRLDKKANLKGCDSEN